MSPARGQTHRARCHRWDRRVQGHRDLASPRRRRCARRADHDRGGPALRRDHDAERAGLRAGPDRAVAQPDHPDSAHEGRPGCRPDPRRPGHREAARGVPHGLQPRSAHQHADRNAGAGHRVPGDAHRDVGTPERRRQRRHAAPTRRAHRRARIRPPGRWRRWAPAGSRRPNRSSPRPSACSGPQDLDRCPGDRVGGRHPRTDRRRSGRRQSQLRQAGLRRGRRGRSPWRRGHPRVDRLAAGADRRHRSSPSRPQPQMQAAIERASGVDRRDRHGGRRRRLPPGGCRRRQDQEARRRPRDRARADARHPRRPRCGQAGRSGPRRIRSRDRRPRRQRHGRSSRRRTST